ncbi:unnamed protein product [Rotaria sp. Silwood1]|nr:unnamed protein product [Rotaria sp. Silwood1]
MGSRRCARRGRVQRPPSRGWTVPAASRPACGAAPAAAAGARACVRAGLRRNRRRSRPAAAVGAARRRASASAASREGLEGGQVEAGLVGMALGLAGAQGEEGVAVGRRADPADVPHLQLAGVGGLELLGELADLEGAPNGGLSPATPVADDPHPGGRRAAGVLPVQEIRQRSGHHPRRHERERRADRGDPRPARAEQARLGAVAHLPEADRHLRLGQELGHAGAGRPAVRDAAAGHADGDGAHPRAGGAAGHPVRDGRRHRARQPDRPRGDDLHDRGGVHLVAGLRDPVAVLLRLPPRLVPGAGLDVQPLDQPDDLRAAAHPRRRGRVAGAADPAVPQLLPRRAGPRLRAHRARQGAGRRHRAAQARVAQRADPHPDQRVRAGARRAGGQLPHRGVLLHPGPGPRALPRRQPRRLPGHPGLRHLPGRADDGGQPGRRRALQGRRPASGPEMRHRLRVPGPDELAESGVRRGHADLRAADEAHGHEPPPGAGARRGAAERAAARDDRRRAGLQPQAADRRRADDGAGRDHPASGHGVAGAAQGIAPDEPAVHLARPGRGGRDLRPRRRHAPRPGAGAGRGGVGAGRVGAGAGAEPAEGPAGRVRPQLHLHQPRPGRRQVHRRRGAGAGGLPGARRRPGWRRGRVARAPPARRPRAEGRNPQAAHRGPGAPGRRAARPRHRAAEPRQRAEGRAGPPAQPRRHAVGRSGWLRARVAGPAVPGLPARAPHQRGAGAEQRVSEEPERDRPADQPGQPPPLPGRHQDAGRPRRAGGQRVPHRRRPLQAHQRQLRPRGRRRRAHRDGAAAARGAGRPGRRAPPRRAGARQPRRRLHAPGPAARGAGVRAARAAGAAALPRPAQRAHAAPQPRRRRHQAAPVRRRAAGAGQGGRDRHRPRRPQPGLRDAGRPAAAGGPVRQPAAAAGLRGARLQPGAGPGAGGGAGADDRAGAGRVAGRRERGSRCAGAGRRGGAAAGAGGAAAAGRAVQPAVRAGAAWLRERRDADDRGQPGAGAAGQRGDERDVAGPGARHGARWHPTAEPGLGRRGRRAAAAVAPRRLAHAGAVGAAAVAGCGDVAVGLHAGRAGRGPGGCAAVAGVAGGAAVVECRVVAAPAAVRGAGGADGLRVQPGGGRVAGAAAWREAAAGVRDARPGGGQPGRVRHRRHAGGGQLLAQHPAARGRVAEPADAGLRRRLHAAGHAAAGRAVGASAQAGAGCHHRSGRAGRLHAGPLRRGLALRARRRFPDGGRLRSGAAVERRRSAGHRRRRFHRAADPAHGPAARRPHRPRAGHAALPQPGALRGGVPARGRRPAHRREPGVHERPRPGGRRAGPGARTPRPRRRAAPRAAADGAGQPHRCVRPDGAAGVAGCTRGRGAAAGVLRGQGPGAGPAEGRAEHSHHRPPVVRPLGVRARRGRQPERDRVALGGRLRARAGRASRADEAAGGAAAGTTGRPLPAPGPRRPGGRRRAAGGDRVAGAAGRPGAGGGRPEAPGCEGFGRRGHRAEEPAAAASRQRPGPHAAGQVAAGRRRSGGRRDRAAPRLGSGRRARRAGTVAGADAALLRPVAQADRRVRRPEPRRPGRHVHAAAALGHGLSRAGQRDRGQGVLWTCAAADARHGRRRHRQRAHQAGGRLPRRSAGRARRPAVPRAEDAQGLAAQGRGAAGAWQGRRRRAAVGPGRGAGPGELRGPHAARAPGLRPPEAGRRHQAHRGHSAGPGQEAAGPFPAGAAGAGEERRGQGQGPGAAAAQADAQLPAVAAPGLRRAPAAG